MKIEFDTTTLKRQIEQNPLAAMGVGAALLTGASKLLTAVTASKNARTWKKEVARRTNNQKSRR